MKCLFDMPVGDENIISLFCLIRPNQNIIRKLRQALTTTNLYQLLDDSSAGVRSSREMAREAPRSLLVVEDRAVHEGIPVPRISNLIQTSRPSGGLERLYS